MLGAPREALLGPSAASQPAKLEEKPAFTAFERAVETVVSVHATPKVAAIVAACAEK